MTELEKKIHDNAAKLFSDILKEIKGAKIHHRVSVYRKWFLTPYGLFAIIQYDLRKKRFSKIIYPSCGKKATEIEGLDGVALTDKIVWKEINIQ